MRMRRLILAIVLVIICTIPANAISPRAISGNVRLDFNDTTAECYAFITANNQDIIAATMRLWQGSRCIAAWNNTGTTYLIFDETTSVTKGKSYELTVDYSVNGESQPRITVSDTCP